MVVFISKQNSDNKNCIAGFLVIEMETINPETTLDDDDDDDGICDRPATPCKFFYMLSAFYSDFFALEVFFLSRAAL